MNSCSGPVFVIGCPRSGTSATGWALAAHPGFWTSAESHVFYMLFRRSNVLQELENVYEQSSGNPDFWLNRNNVSCEEFVRCIGVGLDRLFLSRSKGKRWVDSSPEYTLVAAEIIELMPSSRFVHIVRDGRAVVNSMLNSGFKARWANDFDLACSTWAKYIEDGMRFQQEHPDEAITIHHHTLVDDPEQECRKILGLLGAEQNGAPAEFLRNKRINSSYGNVEKDDIRKPKDPSTLKERPWAAWDQKRKNRFEKLSGKAMELLGFEVLWD